MEDRPIRITATSWKHDWSQFFGHKVTPRNHCQMRNLDDLLGWLRRRKSLLLLSSIRLGQWRCACAEKAGRCIELSAGAIHAFGRWIGLTTRRVLLAVKRLASRIAPCRVEYHRSRCCWGTTRDELELLDRVMLVKMAERLTYPHSISAKDIKKKEQGRKKHDQLAGPRNKRISLPFWIEILTANPVNMRATPVKKYLAATLLTGGETALGCI